MFKRTLSLSVIVCFFLTTIAPYTQARADTILGLPQPGTMVDLSPAYVPVIVKGLRVHPEDPILFDFIVDTGNTGLSSNDPQLKAESEKLIKYFLASLTIPEDDLWVNLSPYEKNRIIPEQLGQTEMGRDMLAEDYMLKQITASLIYPEKDLGKEFWEKVYIKARQQYGTSAIPVNTFNKVWIVADKAKVYVHANTAFVVASHLKVMLEEDYLALSKHQSTQRQPGDMASAVSPSTLPSDAALNPKAPQGNPRNDVASIGANIVRQIILPQLEKEVNSGKNFANLRQIFHSMILAAWYKKNLKQALLNQVYSNKAKINGVDVADKTIKEQIYKEYLQAYKKGVFNYIKEDIQNGQAVPRKYFSGGEEFERVLRDLAQTSNPDDPDVRGFSVDGAMIDIAVRTPEATPDAAMFVGSGEIPDYPIKILFGSLGRQNFKIRLRRVSTGVRYKLEGFDREIEIRLERDSGNQFLYSVKRGKGLKWPRHLGFKIEYDESGNVILQNTGEGKLTYTAFNNGRPVENNSKASTDAAMGAMVPSQEDITRLVEIMANTWEELSVKRIPLKDKDALKEILKNASGVQGKIDIWKAVMKALHSVAPNFNDTSDLLTFIYQLPGMGPWLHGKAETISSAALDLYGKEIPKDLLIGKLEELCGYLISSGQDVIVASERINRMPSIEFKISNHKRISNFLNKLSGIDAAMVVRKGIVPTFQTTIPFAFLGDGKFSILLQREGYKRSYTLVGNNNEIVVYLGKGLEKRFKVVVKKGEGAQVIQYEYFKIEYGLIGIGLQNLGGGELTYIAFNNGPVRNKTTARTDAAMSGRPLTRREIILTVLSAAALVAGTLVWTDSYFGFSNSLPNRTVRKYAKDIQDASKNQDAGKMVAAIDALSRYVSIYSLDPVLNFETRLRAFYALRQADANLVIKMYEHGTVAYQFRQRKLPFDQLFPLLLEAHYLDADQHVNFGYKDKLSGAFKNRVRSLGILPSDNSWGLSTIEDALSSINAPENVPSKGDPMVINALGELASANNRTAVEYMRNPEVFKDPADSLEHNISNFDAMIQDAGIVQNIDTPLSRLLFEADKSNSDTDLRTHALKFLQDEVDPDSLKKIRDDNSLPAATRQKTAQVLKVLQKEGNIRAFDQAMASITPPADVAKQHGDNAQITGVVRAKAVQNLGQDKTGQALVDAVTAGMQGLSFTKDAAMSIDGETVIENADQSMTGRKTPGGIDLNARNLGLDVSGEKIDLQFDKATIEQFRRGDFTGVKPVIITITPIVNVMPLLGLKEENAHLASV